LTAGAGYAPDLRSPQPMYRLAALAGKMPHPTQNLQVNEGQAAFKKAETQFSCIAGTQ